jgi:hypothetical protein
VALDVARPPEGALAQNAFRHVRSRCGKIARCFYYFFLVVVITHKTKATACRALTLIVRIFVNDAIAIAVWTSLSFHKARLILVTRRSSKNGSYHFRQVGGPSLQAFQAVSWSARDSQNGNTNSAPGDKHEPQGFILTTLLGIAGAFVMTYLVKL